MTDIPARCVESVDDHHAPGSAQQAGGAANRAHDVEVGVVHRAKPDASTNAKMMYRRYNHDPALLMLEQEARGARRGF